MPESTQRRSLPPYTQEEDGNKVPWEGSQVEIWMKRGERARKGKKEGEEQNASANIGANGFVFRLGSPIYLPII